MIDIQTDRLRFRQWALADFEAFAHYFATAANTRFLGGTKLPEEAWRLMASYVGHYHLLGYSYAPIIERSSGRLVGSVGLWNSAAWPEPELGYWFLPEGQGKGYAFEAAQALKQYAKEQVELPTLVSYISVDNVPSQKLATKLGATLDGTTDLLTFGEHMVYRYW